MLELQKFVLQRVCEDMRLFKKELEKSLQWLSLPEVERLREWVYREFGQSHAHIINDVFATVKV